MRTLAFAVAALVLALPVSAQQPAPPVLVKDGHTLGVFYGFSVVSDMWGNSRKAVWTLRNDGLVMWAGPDGPLEEFDGRELTKNEKENGSATYVIDGEKFNFTYRDGTASTGKIKYRKDGGIEVIEASALRFYPVRPLTFALSGRFDSATTFNNAAYGMSTTAWKGYSFYPNGTFVMESGAGTTCTHIESYESIEREVTSFHGAEARSRMGKFKVEGTGLTLSFADGNVEKRYIGQIFDPMDDGMVWILIGRGQFDGKPGVFPGAAAPPPPVGKPVEIPKARLLCQAEQFEVLLPVGWNESSEENNGLTVHTLVPGDASAGLAILAIGLDVDASTRAKTADAENELRSAVAGFVGKKLTAAGGIEDFEIDGVPAVRVPSTFEREGVTMRADAIYAVKSGRAMFLIALGTMEGSKTFAPDLRVILSAVTFATDETKNVSTADFKVKVPKAWTATKDEAGTTLSLSPKGVESSEFFAAIVSQASEFKSVREKKALAWLREQVTAAVPGVEKQGDPEKMTIDGQPAVGITYAGAKDDGTVAVIHLYALIKDGKMAMLFMGGKRELVEKHSGAARRAFETLKMK